MDQSPSDNGHPGNDPFSPLGEEQIGNFIMQRYLMKLFFGKKSTVLTT